MYKIFAVFVAVLFTTYFGVKVFRGWSLRRQLFDIPNERSSHSVPTPRGGGVVIFTVSILVFFIYCLVSGLDRYWSYFAGAVIVAGISLLDDLKNISPFLRFLFHALAAGLVVWFIGGFGEILLPFYGIVRMGLAGDVLAFFWIVWLINAYNFMDGIDGIAATQAVSAGIGWSLSGYYFGVEGIWFYGGVLAASALGFLWLNWQPAKIFMGDVGSAFFGYSFAVIPLFWQNSPDNPNSGSEIRPKLLWLGIIFVWFFVFDSIFTFFKRLFRGEKVWRAHRKHIYQKMVIAGLSHSIVTLVYGFFSAWLVVLTVLAINDLVSFEKTVVPSIAAGTALLIIIWQMAVRNEKSDRGFEDL